MLKNIDIFLSYIEEKTITANELNCVRSDFIKKFTNDVVLKNNITEKTLEKAFGDILLNAKKDKPLFNYSENIISQIKNFAYWIQNLDLEQSLLNQKKFLRNNIILSALSERTTKDIFFNKFMKHLKDLAFMEKDTSIYIRGLPYLNDREANKAFQFLIHKSGMTKKNIFWKKLVINILENNAVNLNEESFYEIAAWDILKNDKQLGKQVIASYLNNNDHDRNIKDALEMLNICLNKESAVLLVKELSSYCENISEVVIKYHNKNITFKESVMSRQELLPEMVDFFINHERGILEKTILKSTDKMPVIRI